jgi:hypothetical protein
MIDYSADSVPTRYRADASPDELNTNSDLTCWREREHGPAGGPQVDLEGLVVDRECLEIDRTQPGGERTAKNGGSCGAARGSIGAGCDL